MLSISEIAKKFGISNQAVHQLLEYGHLNVTEVQRNPNRGIQFLFCENEVNQIDIYSKLAEIKSEGKTRIPMNPSSDFKKVIQTMDYYNDFMENIAQLPESKLLQTCFYLFHLNHYAKTYAENRAELYQLKRRVIKKLFNENVDIIKPTYLLGPDRNKVWLCEDCKDNCRSMGISFNHYIRQEYYCSKCFVQVLEKEYYSLFEFHLNIENHRFTFHLPKSLAQKWLDWRLLPQSNRRAQFYQDRMYLYGRRISRVEEKAFPLPRITEYLSQYLNGNNH